MNSIKNKVTFLLQNINYKIFGKLLEKSSINEETKNNKKKSVYSYFKLIIKIPY